jgi:hypothetical protein
VADDENWKSGVRAPHCRDGFRSLKIVLPALDHDQTHVVNACDHALDRDVLEQSRHHRESLAREVLGKVAPQRKGGGEDENDPSFRSNRGGRVHGHHLASNRKRRAGTCYRSLDLDEEIG